MRRLKAKEIREFRENQYKEQNGICPLCQCFIEPHQSVADHRHSDGKMRKTLHRNCNLVLGKFENALKRYCIDDFRARNISLNIFDYMSATTDILHHTHRTPEERKALLKKRRQRKKR